MIIRDTITCQRIQTILALCDRAPACRARGAGRCLFLQSIYLSSYQSSMRNVDGFVRSRHPGSRLSPGQGAPGSRHSVTARRTWIPAPVPDPDPGFAGMTRNNVIGLFTKSSIFNAQCSMINDQCEMIRCLRS